MTALDRVVDRRSAARRGRAGLWLGLWLGLAPGVLPAQEPDLRRQIQDSQRRLEEIRAERERLQSEMEALRTRVRDVSSELRNVERQLSASRSVLAEVNFQLEATSEQIEETTRRLVTTRERLSEGRAVLHRRLRDIYKRGSLHTVRVLLSAESFPELLTRYRYLQLLAAYDQALVQRVTVLERELVLQDEELRANLAELGRLRQARLGEVAQLRQVEGTHQQTLTTFRSRERQAVTRLEQLDRDEARMTGLIADLERRRVEEERRLALGGAGAAPTSLSAAHAGTLEWPVDGNIVYRFGREVRPNGTVLRWNGVGIGASTGTPVRAVADGRVVLAGPFEGYGPTVVLSHGGGFYTLYLYLEEIGVLEGRDVGAGQVVGTVGGANTPEGPHLEFQIRAPVAGSAPVALDPLQWLRPRLGNP